MRKWLLLAAFGLLMQPASATTVTKKIDVPEFTGIVAGSVYDVTLIRSDGCSVEVLSLIHILKLRVEVLAGRVDLLGFFRKLLLLG